MYMHIGPSNPIIKKTVSDFLQKDLFFAEHAYDYDNTCYQVTGIEGANLVRFSLKCNCSGLVSFRAGIMLPRILSVVFVQTYHFEPHFRYEP